MQAPTRALLVLEFTTMLLELAEAEAFSVTSWGRTPAHNHQLGGDPRSFHLEWLAVDAVPDDRSRSAALVARARAMGLDAVDEGDHVHLELDYRKRNAHLDIP